MRKSPKPSTLADFAGGATNLATAYMMMNQPKNNAQIPQYAQVPSYVPYMNSNTRAA